VSTENPTVKESLTVQDPQAGDLLDEPVRQIAEWAVSHGLSTGHGGSLADLMSEIGWQIEELKTENAKLRDALDSLHVLLEGGGYRIFLWYSEDPFASKVREKVLAALSPANASRQESPGEDRS